MKENKFKVCLYVIMAISAIIVLVALNIEVKTVMHQLVQALRVGFASVIFSVCLAGLYVGK